MQSHRLGFIGLGQMGSGMANNLLQGGVDLCVYDINEAELDRFQSAGAKIANSPADLAEQVDYLFLCLPFVPEVEAALYSKDGVMSAKTEELTVIDTSTLPRSAAIDFQEKLETKNVQYCDCPVSGLPARAQNGTLTMMFGGLKSIFDQVECYLDMMGTSNLYCGDVGNGQMMKAINNIIYNINIAGFCEIMPLAIKAGLDADQVAQLLLSGSSRSFASEHFVPKIMKNDFGGDFPMGDAYKDIKNVQEIAIEHDAHTPIMQAMISSYQSTLAMGLGNQPKSAIIKMYEKMTQQSVTDTKKNISDKTDD